MTKPLILFSGLGADASIFQPQLNAFPELIVPEWSPLRDQEGFQSYCKRLAEQIDPGCPCVIGGASFGGMVAMEVAQHLDAQACLLIGSIRNERQLPLRIRALRPIGFGVALLPVTWLQRAAALSARFAPAATPIQITTAMQQFSGADPTLIRWSARQILRWKAPKIPIPIFRIHGERDHIFPIRHTTPDEVVHGGGHIISLTHARQVNLFLRVHLDQVFANRLEK